MKTLNKIPIKYSQNFLKSTKWLTEFIRTKTNISKTDTVLDIGAGNGTITKELSKTAAKVIAFELDKNQSNKIPLLDNVSINSIDFLEFDLNSLREYKVFANIPFFLSAAIIRKLFIESANQPTEAYLFMQYEFYERIKGQPLINESLMSLLLKPFWDVSLVHTFSRYDFVPPPSVKVVLVKFTAKNNIIDDGTRTSYFDFVSFVLNKRKPSLKLDLLDLFTFKQLQKISKDLKFNLKQTPRDLNFEQWLGLFSRFNNFVEAAKQIQITDSYIKLLNHKDSQDNKSIVY